MNNTEIKRYARKLIKEYIGDTATRKEQNDFLKRVLSKLSSMDLNTQAIITTGFGNNMNVNFDTLSDIELENLYNSIDQKLKSRNERSPYEYDSTSNKYKAF